MIIEERFIIVPVILCHTIEIYKIQENQFMAGTSVFKRSIARVLWVVPCIQW